MNKGGRFLKDDYNFDNYIDCLTQIFDNLDCFILDTPVLIWVYIGRYSKRVEKLKAIQAANQIRDQDHGGRLKIQMIG